ncbi:hypothetical protein [Mesorhizobium marinum]|uniref:Lipoprotein n=1 Tax=Mesorhizobium marinum TaxID=3228790 RepID=A0ABV3QZU6_9HYPH
MKNRNSGRVVAVAPLVVSGLLVSGCMSSPTYGTGVSQNEQLTTDLSSMFSLKPKKQFASDYTPRPELVKPTKGTTDLPAPQENIVTADASQWPESPEQRRARIRADATENRDTAGWSPEVINDLSVDKSSNKPKFGSSSRSSESGVAPAGGGEDLNKKGAQFKQELAMTKQGSPTVRRTLSEPPLDYRKPAESAPTDELGEDEFKKQRRLKAEARKASGSKSWKDLIPWL